MKTLIALVASLVLIAPTTARSRTVPVLLGSDTGSGVPNPTNYNFAYSFMLVFPAPVTLSVGDQVVIPFGFKYQGGVSTIKAWDNLGNNYHLAVTADAVPAKLTTGLMIADVTYPGDIYNVELGWTGANIHQLSISAFSLSGGGVGSFYATTGAFGTAKHTSCDAGGSMLNAALWEDKGGASYSPVGLALIFTNPTAFHITPGGASTRSSAAYCAAVGF